MYSFQRFGTINRLHAPAAHFIESALRFDGPKLLNFFVLQRIETFHEAICKQGSGFTGKRKCCIGDLIN